MAEQRPRSPTPAPITNGGTKPEQPHLGHADPQVQPEAQAQFFRRADEALRIEWKQSRHAFLAQQGVEEQHHHQQYLLPNVTNTSSIPPTLVTVANDEQRIASAPYPHGAYGQHPSPPPPPRMRMIAPVRAYWPIFGKPHTYPPLLSSVLDQCAREASRLPSTNDHHRTPTWTVIRCITNNFTPPKLHVIDQFWDLHKANLQVLKRFIDDYWSENMEEPFFEALARGRLRCEIQMNGFMGTRESLYVKEDFSVVEE